MGFMRELGKMFGNDDSRRDTYREHDVRGWPLTDESGATLGRMDDWMVDDEHGRVRYGIVDVDGRRKLLPVSDLNIDDDRRTVIARGMNITRLNTLRDYDASTWNETTEREVYREHNPEWKGDTLDYETDRYRGNVPQRIQLMEEQLRLGKRAVPTGEVEIGKRPVSETVSKDVTLEQERLEINRQPVNKPVEGQAIGDEERVKVTLFGEEPVVDKQTVVREEVDIDKVKDQRTETVTDEVKREELVTEGLEGQREATFASAQPTDAELVERNRYEQQRLNDEKLDVLPIDDQNRTDRPI